MSDMVTWTVEDGIATVRLVSPTMPPAFFDAFRESVEAVAAAPDLRAVLVVSEAKGFSYGLDLARAFASHGELFRGGLAGKRQELLALIRGWQRAFDALAELPVPTIAAVHGWCIGAGLDLVSACDIRVCSADAKFSLRETKIAIVADLGSLQRLPGIIGQGPLRQMAYTGGDVTADQALQWGLVNEVHADRAAAHAAAHAMAQQIAENSPLVVRGVKDVLRFGEEPRRRDGLQYVAAWNAAFLASEDLAEAVQAWASKRKPVFKGQ